MPTVVHEQNAVLGRVNRLFAGRVDAIATAYPEVERLDPKHPGKCIWSAIPYARGRIACATNPSRRWARKACCACW